MQILFMSTGLIFPSYNLILVQKHIYYDLTIGISLFNYRYI